MKELIDNVLSWADERNLLRPECAETQYHKFLEEVGETAKAILKNDQAGIIDGFGDIVVTVIILAKQLDISIKTKITGYDLGLKNKSLSYFMGDITVDFVDKYILLYISRVCNSYGYSLEECLQAAWNEIKDRKGKTINGTFIKESDLTDELLEEFLP